VSDPIDPHLNERPDEETPLVGPQEEAAETAPARAASMTLRDADAREETASLDPAQQSLNQALRLSFGLLKILMVVLFVLFLTSGFRTIQEGNRGLRLRFGAIQDAEAVGSGAVWTYPQPIGELVIVPATPQDVPIDGFLPGKLPAEQDRDWTQLTRAPSAGMVPGRDGYLLTSDGNIVHAEWSVRYRIEDAVKKETHLAHGELDKLVRVAAEQGIVYAISRTTIDDPQEEIYDPLVGSREVVAAMARRKAQETLSILNSGVIIDSMTIEETSPPLQAKEIFTRVATAQSAAQQEREQARQEAVQTLNEVGGEAHSRLVSLIDLYGQHVEKGEEAEAEQTLARIEGILVGAPLPPDSDVRIAGTAASIIEEAKRERVGIRQAAEAEYRTFRAMREQFAEAPVVTITKYWQDAYLSVLNDPYTQTLLVPANAEDLEVILGPDPDIMRELWKRLREDEAARARGEYEERRGLAPDPTAARRERDRQRDQR
jgi:regulator of protease activity HflC (stomatin/prohibitin superfamily)